MISRKQLLTFVAALSAGAIATPFAAGQSGAGTSGAGVGGAFGYSSGGLGMPDSSYTNDVSGDDLTAGPQGQGASARSIDALQNPSGSRWGENEHVSRGEGKSRFSESEFGTLNEGRDRQGDVQERRTNTDDRLSQTNRSYDPQAARARDTMDGRLERRSTGLADADRARADELQADPDEDAMLNQEDGFDRDTYAYGLDGH